MCLAVDVFVLSLIASLWLAGGGYTTHCTHVVFMQDVHLFSLCLERQVVLHKLQGQFVPVLRTLHVPPGPVCIVMCHCILFGCSRGVVLEAQGEWGICIPGSAATQDTICSGEAA